MAALRRRRKKRAPGPREVRTPTAAAPVTPPASPAPCGDATDRSTADIVIEVATRIWRSRRHAQNLAVPSRLLVRELDVALARLEEVGLVVQGHDGDRFDPGQALIAVAYQPTAGLTHETVMETLQPSVYLGRDQVQRGEVVVGVPEPANAQPDAEPADAEPAEPETAEPETGAAR
jgi:hypothetical protein